MLTFCNRNTYWRTRQGVTKVLSLVFILPHATTQPCPTPHTNTFGCGAPSARLTVGVGSWLTDWLTDLFSRNSVDSRNPALNKTQKRGNQRPFLLDQNPVNFDSFPFKREKKGRYLTFSWSWRCGGRLYPIGVNGVQITQLRTRSHRLESTCSSVTLQIVWGGIEINVGVGLGVFP